MIDTTSILVSCLFLVYVAYRAMKMDRAQRGLDRPLVAWRSGKEQTTPGASSKRSDEDGLNT